MVDALTIARHILWYCTQQGTPVSNLKLQKILYFAWADYYCKKHEHLFEDKIYAWQFGPVVPRVYYAYCQYANMSIYINESPLHLYENITLDAIVDKYRVMSVSSLVEKSHQIGKPWQQIYGNGDGNRRVIPFELIKRLECGIS